MEAEDLNAGTQVNSSLPLHSAQLFIQQTYLEPAVSQALLATLDNVKSTKTVSIEGDHRVYWDNR
jgi:hypothetical protein